MCRRDDWRGLASDEAVTTFYTEEQTTPNPQGVPVGNRVTIVTAPDGTKSISVSNIKAPGEWDDGLLTETRISTTENNQEKVWSRTKLFWVQGNNLPTGRDNPRLSKIEVTDDAGGTRATSFEYDIYNNQTVVKEHDFAAAGTLGAELRRTETAYETGAGWIANRLLRLPKSIQTVVNNAVVSKVRYEYDNYVNNDLVATPGVPQHLESFDPYTTGTHNCNCRYECYGSATTAQNCPDGSPPSYECDQCSNYDPNTAYRGNVTKVTAFSDAALETDANAVVSTSKYDITGNVVEAGVSCCRRKAWTYDLANGYAYPITEASGDAGQLVTSAVYDFYTGLVKTATDENNQTSTLTYNTNNLRITRTDSPNGAWATTEYNDATYPYYVKQTASLDAARSVSSWSFSNGRGAGFQAKKPDGRGLSFF